MDINNRQFHWNEAWRLKNSQIVYYLLAQEFTQPVFPYL